MILRILRLVFLALSAGLAWWTAAAVRLHFGPSWLSMLAGGCVMAGAVGLVALDVVSRDRRRTLWRVFFGIAAGLVLAGVAGLGIGPLGLPDRLAIAVQVGLILLFSYGCTSALVQAGDSLRLGLPAAVPGASESSPACLLDTSAIIDGRIADVVATGIIDGRLLVPSFVLTELQSIADSSDRLRRARGRRGLDVLNRLRGEAGLQVFDRELPEFNGQPVDAKLVLLAKHLSAKIITHDYNLNKVAQVHGVSVINLNDLTHALKPIFLPGEQLEVHLIKAGEAAGQGIGYLEDGTMIVVEAGRERLNQTVKITVTSVLQTSAGRMIFGR